MGRDVLERADHLHAVAQDLLRFLGRRAGLGHDDAAGVVRVERDRHVHENLALHLGAHRLQRLDVRRIGHRDEHHVGRGRGLHVVGAAQQVAAEFGVEFRGDPLAFLLLARADDDLFAGQRPA